MITGVVNVFAESLLFVPLDCACKKLWLRITLSISTLFAAGWFSWDSRLDWKPVLESKCCCICWKDGAYPPGFCNNGSVDE